MGEKQQKHGGMKDLNSYVDKEDATLQDSVVLICSSAK